jgi:hypothetical protein
MVDNNEFSETADVSFGVHQGIMLDHVLFLIFIYNLHNDKLFANDCIMHRNITRTPGTTRLQEDLNYAPLRGGLYTNVYSAGCWCRNQSPTRWSLFTKLLHYTPK